MTSIFVKDKINGDLIINCHYWLLAYISAFKYKKEAFMKNFHSDDIEKLVDFMKNNAINEIKLEDLNSSLHIKGNGFKYTKKEEKPIEQEVQEEIKSEEVVSGTNQDEHDSNIIPIVSNMIGLFFLRPAPDEEPFVNVGDEIKEGQTVCIIETIKLMNKISSDVAGKVVEICIEDGKPVEYGQVIMYVEKN